MLQCYRQNGLLNVHSVVCDGLIKFKLPVICRFDNGLNSEQNLKAN